MQGWIEGLGVWVLACVSIMPKRNKTRDKRIDTKIWPIAYPEDHHSETVTHSTESPVCLTGQKSSTHDARKDLLVVAYGWVLGNTFIFLLRPFCLFEMGLIT